MARFTVSFDWEGPEDVEAHLARLRRACADSPATSFEAGPASNGEIRSGSPCPECGGRLKTGESHRRSPTSAFQALDYRCPECGYRSPVVFRPRSEIHRRGPNLTPAERKARARAKPKKPRRKYRR